MLLRSITQVTFVDMTYCAVHNIIFNTVENYAEHIELCSSLMRPNTCTVLKVDGKMCGEVFVHTSSLLHHCHQVHSLFLCAVCDFVTPKIDDMELHKHIGICNIHECN